MRRIHFSGGASYRQIRAYHFRSGPTTRPGAKKYVLRVVHSLAFLSVQNAGKPFGSAPDPAGGAYIALPQTPSWWEGAGCPFPRTPPPLSALRASNLGPSGLTPYLPKSVYQNPPM